MATLDWSQCPAVESIPGKVSGAWVFKDTRMPVSIVFQNLEAGAGIEEIMEWYHLTREQIVTVLDFAARSLEAPVPANVPPTSDARPVCSQRPGSTTASPYGTCCNGSDRARMGQAFQRRIANGSGTGWF